MTQAGVLRCAIRGLVMSSFALTLLACSHSKDWTGDFKQVQNIRYSIMGNEKRAQIQYQLKVTSSTFVWTLTDLDSGHLNVSCSGNFEPPTEGRNVVVRARADCQGDAAFFEPLNKTLVYSAESDSWTVNSRHLLQDISVTVVRDQ